MSKYPTERQQEIVGRALFDLDGPFDIPAKKQTNVEYYRWTDCYGLSSHIGPYTAHALDVVERMAQREFTARITANGKYKAEFWRGLVHSSATAPDAGSAIVKAAASALESV